MGQQINPIIGNLVTQLQTNLQQIGTSMPGTLQPDGSVTQPIDLNNFGAILQEFNQNLSGAMYTGTAQYGQQQQQALEQRQQQGQQGQPQEPGQAPQQPQGQQGQPQKPGQRKIPTPEEINWDRLYSRGHVTKGNALKLAQNNPQMAAFIFSRNFLGIPPEWYGVGLDRIPAETKWPSTSPEGFVSAQGQQYPQSVQREQFNTGLKGLYDYFISQFGPEEGHKKAIEILGPGGLGIPFRGSYRAEGEAGGEDFDFGFGGELGEFAPGRYRPATKTHRTSKEYGDLGTGIGAALDWSSDIQDLGKAIKGEDSMY